MTEIPTSGMPSRVDRVDHFVDARDVLVLDERRELVDALVLGRVGVRPPPAVVVLGHVEQPERDDLVLIADVARVVGPLKAGWHGVTRFPRAAELLPRTRLQAAGGEHDDHRVTSSVGWIVRVRPRCAWTSCTAIAPSPTAVAHRFVEPERTSPAAKMPGTLVSSRCSACASAPVRMKPFSSRSTASPSHSVHGRAPRKRNRNENDTRSPLVSVTASRCPSSPCSAAISLRSRTATP